MDISACEHHTHILDSVAKYYVLPYNKCLPHTVFSVFFQRICYQWPVTLSSFHTVWCCSGCSQLFWHDDTDTNGWANVNRGTQPAGAVSGTPGSGLLCGCGRGVAPGLLWWGGWGPTGLLLCARGLLKPTESGPVEGVWGREERQHFVNQYPGLLMLPRAEIEQCTVSEY